MRRYKLIIIIKSSPTKKTATTSTHTHTHTESFICIIHKYKSLRQTYIQTTDTHMCYLPTYIYARLHIHIYAQSNPLRFVLVCWCVMDECEWCVFVTIPIYEIDTFHSFIHSFTRFTLLFIKWTTKCVCVCVCLFSFCPSPSKILYFCFMSSYLLILILI